MDRAVLLVFNPLNANIVVAKLSLSAEIVFIKESCWLFQSIKVFVNALVRVIKLYSNLYTLLTAYTSIL